MKPIISSNPFMGTRNPYTLIFGSCLDLFGRVQRVFSSDANLTVHVSSTVSWIVPIQELNKNVTFVLK